MPILKKWLTVFAVALSSVSAAQNCPVITSWNLVTVSNNGLGSCTYRVDFTMSVNGNNKSVQLIVTCAGSPALNQCIGVNSSQNGVTLSSNTFTCSCSSTKSLSFNSFTNGSCGGASCTATGNVLPVTILSIQLLNRNGLACLSWRVAEESDTDKYLVEYSADGVHFSESGYVTALNSMTEHDYSFCDPVERRGGFYRLKITEFSGKVSYSNVLKFTAATDPEINIYPNPAGASLGISMPFSGRLNNAGYEIYAADGKRVISGKLRQPVIDISALTPGVYYLALRQDSEQVGRKVFIKN